MKTFTTTVYYTTPQTPFTRKIIFIRPCENYTNLLQELTHEISYLENEMNANIFDIVIESDTDD